MRHSLIIAIVVAVVVVVAKVSAYADASAEIGIYVFAGHVLISMTVAKIFYHYDQQRRQNQIATG